MEKAGDCVLKTLLLIGYFASGVPFEQELDAAICLSVTAALAQHETVEAETTEGVHELIEWAACVEHADEEIS